MQKADETLFVRACSWWIFRSPAVIFVVATAVLILVKDQAGHAPNAIYWVSLARQFPHHIHGAVASAAHLQESPIGFAIAHYLGLTSVRAYATMHECVVLLDFLVIAIGGYRIGGRRGLGWIVLLFAVMPITDVMMAWLGMQDPFTILFLSLFVLYDEVPVAFVAGVGLGLSHYEVGIICAVAWGILWAVRRSTYRLTPKGIALLSGLALGIGVLAYAESLTGGSLAERAKWVEGKAPTRRYSSFGMVRLLLGAFPAWLVSSFQSAWLVVVLVIAKLRTTHRSLALAVIATLICLVLPCLVTEDETRIYALLSWAVVLWLARDMIERVEAHDGERLVATITLCLWLAMPHLTVWIGVPHASWR